MFRSLLIFRAGPVFLHSLQLLIPIFVQGQPLQTMKVRTSAVIMSSRLMSNNEHVIQRAYRLGQVMFTTTLRFRDKMHPYLIDLIVVVKCPG